MTTALADAPAVARERDLPMSARRRLLVVLGALLAVAMVGWTTLGLVDLMAHQRSDIHLSFAVPAHRVNIHLGSGSVHIVAASGATVDVGRHLSYGLTHPHVSERIIAGALIIDTTCVGAITPFCTARYDLAVPPDFAVTASSSADSVAVSGISGPLDLSSSAGSVSATDISSTDVRAHSTAGSVKVTLTVDARRVDATSTAGAVEVLVPAHGPAYRVDAHTTAGGTDVNVATDPQSDRLITARSTAGGVLVGTR